MFGVGAVTSRHARQSVSAHILSTSQLIIHGSPKKHPLSLNRIEDPLTRLDFSPNLSVKQALEYCQLVGTKYSMLDLICDVISYFFETAVGPMGTIGYKCI